MEAVTTTVPRSFSWYEVWLKIYFHPAVSSFQEILADPKAKPGRAMIWVAITAFILSIIKWSISGKFVFMFWVIDTIIAVAALIIITFVIHIISKLFSGQGTYYQLMYCIGAALAPYYIVLWALKMADRLLGYPANLIVFIFMAVYLAWWVLGFILIMHAVRAAEKISLRKGILITSVFALLVIILLITPIGQTIRSSFF